MSGVLGTIVGVLVLAVIVWAQIGGLFSRRYPRKKP
jgi:hypothetical protein